MQKDENGGSPPNNKKYKPAKYFNVNFSISPSTLRRWANDGTVECIKLPGGKRLYDEQNVRSIIGAKQNVDKEKKGYIYARVSTPKQKEDLERQIEELKREYPNCEVISDIASGINFKRRGLHSILDKVNKGLVGKVICMHKDRLARFSVDLLEYIFKINGTELVVHRKGDGEEPTDMLAKDLLAITTVFVASHNGKRAAENKRKRKGGENEEKEGKRQKNELSSIEKDKV